MKNTLQAGAKLVETAEEAWNQDMVMKVKEPVASEYGYFREGLILFTYLHLAPEPELTKALIDNKVVCNCIRNSTIRQSFFTITCTYE